MAKDKTTQSVKKPKQQSRLSKYRSIIIYVVLFLLFDAAILAFNYYMSAQIAKDTTAINLAARQGILTQEMAKQVMNIDLLTNNTMPVNEQPPTATVANANDVTNATQADTVTPATATTDAETAKTTANTEQPPTQLVLSDAAETTITNLKNSRNIFDKTLTAFAQGGQTTASDGSPVALVAVTNSDGVKSIANAKEIWQPYVRLIDSFLASVDSGKLNKSAIGYAVDYARTFNDNLFYEVNDLTQSLEAQAKQKAQLLQWVQTAGIVIAFILFFLIVFGALRQLLKTDDELAEAQEQTAEILATVNEGLFLIDKDLIIANEYSQELEHIINQQNLGGRKLTDVLEKLVSAENLDITQTYVEQLYSDWVVEDLINDLNPLKKLQVQLETAKGIFDTRYLDFKFSRVYKNKEIIRILVNVFDITDAIKLQQRLDNEKAQNDRQIEMLSTIINSEPSLLDNFIKTTLARIKKINSILKTPGTGLSNMRNKAEEIYREVHSLKGESSAMKLDSFVNISESLESKVKKLAEKPDLVGEDFLGLTVSLEELLNLTVLVDNLSERIGFSSKAAPLNLDTNTNTDTNFEEKLAQVTSPTHKQMGSHATTAVNDAQPVMQRYYQKFAQDIAKRNNKQIQFNCLGMDNIKLADEKNNLLKDISIQLLRNAIVHGIEPTDIRQQQHKQPQGQVNLSLTENKNGLLELSIYDDGQGINFEKIKQKALQNGKYPPAQVNQWTKKQLLQLLFQSGFSTADGHNEDAGRGVGMDIIKNLVEQLHGKLKISSKPHEFTRFSIVFPKS